MSNAWETTEDDVLNVAHAMGMKLKDGEAERILNNLNQFEIENAAMRGDDMDTQTECAYKEIMAQMLANERSA